MAQSSQTSSSPALQIDPELLLRAQATGMDLPAAARQRFFAATK